MGTTAPLAVLPYSTWSAFSRPYLQWQHLLLYTCALRCMQLTARATLVCQKDNALAGTIPDTFFDELINITALDLSYNSLSGTMPTEAGKMRSLRSLELSNNRLTGTIPTEIANMGSALGYGLTPGGLEGLTHFDISHNNLTGIIPSEVHSCVQEPGHSSENAPRPPSLAPQLCVHAPLSVESWLISSTS